MGLFKPGEEAIAVGKRQGVRDCIIVKLSSSRRWGNMQHYVIDVPSLPSKGKKGTWLIPEHSLRKKKPPKEELGSWEEVQKITEGWNPVKEKQDA